MKARVIVSIILLMAATACAAGAFDAGSVRAVRLEFNLAGMNLASVEGSVSGAGGDILRIEGWSFLGSDLVKIGPNNSWTATTAEWPAGTIRGVKPDAKQVFNGTTVQPVGVTIYYRGRNPTLDIRLGSANQTLRPDELQGFAPKPLGDHVAAYRVPVVEDITGPKYQDDYPAIAADNSGDVWTAWIGYANGADDIFVRRKHGEAWSEPVKLTGKSRNLFSPAIAVDKNDRVWVGWSERRGSGWAIVTRSFEARKWSRPEVLTKGGSNFSLRMRSGREMNFVWQGLRGGRSDIFYKSFDGGKWSEIIDLSDPNKSQHANDWSPSIATDVNGKVWVAWDSYDTGSYNIRLRSIENGVPGQIIRVTDSLKFHAKPSLALDKANRLWVAYEEAEENWGKDNGFIFGGQWPLYLSRRIRFAVLDGEKRLQPKDDLNLKVSEGSRQFVQSPTLIADARGKMWVFFRPRTHVVLAPPSYEANYAQWDLVASCYSGGSWSAPVAFPSGSGRNDAPFDVVSDSSGRLWAAWVMDHRKPGKEAYNGGENDVYVGSFEAPPSGEAMALVPRSSEPPAGERLEPREPEQVARVRNYTVQSEGKTYHIYRGDLHRHSEISLDGVWEGSLTTVYRYMFDAGALDFGAVTDHVIGWKDWDYPRWRNDKMADLFNVPGSFSAIFGYERSVASPNGHRNVFFDHRVKPLPVTDDENKLAVNTGKALYPYLRETGGICVSHTSSGWNHGTDWRDGDSEVEPIAEIFQGCRSSSEHEGAPLVPAEGLPNVEKKGSRPDGWLWNAWAKGYKLGVIASSDHWSTHCSYACVLAENNSREALMDAMRKRHTYAATTNIIMDFRTRDSTGEHIMGDITNSKTIPELSLKVICTAPIKEVVIIRDNKYVDRRPGTGEEMSFTFKEPSLESGEHYYYARVEQTDKHVAWSSPIWVTYAR